MFAVLKTLEFWIAFAVIAILVAGGGVLKRYLKKIVRKCDQTINLSKEEQNHKKKSEKFS